MTYTMDDVSFGLLKLYAQKDSLSAHDISLLTGANVRGCLEPIHYLLDNEYLEVQPSLHGHAKMFDVQYRITPDGHRALELEQKNRRFYKHNELRAWITLGIAIAAFILSVISLILQT